MPERTPKNLIDRFTHSVDNQVFYEIADSMLIKITDVEELARCSILASKRQPGGSFYRAKFWNRVNDILSSHENEKSYKRKFLKICKQNNIHPSTAKGYIIQGQAIEKVEQLCLNIDYLREASEELFNQAKRQKERAGEYLVEATKALNNNPNLTHTKIHRLWCQKNGNIKENLDIIKPSDWWAFSHPKWRKEDDFLGSIPGEIYANALYYFAPRVGAAIDPMAGSGMLKRVYDDRKKWQKDINFELDIHLFDLYPSRDFIKKHDACHSLPIKADWIFLDPPYFGQSSHLFKGDLAAIRDYQHYLSFLKKIIIAMELSLNINGRLCVFLPKWSGLRPEDPNYNLPSDAYTLAINTGLKWIDTAFVSRGRQQEPGSATKNNYAKRNRRMRSDTCILNVFEKRGSI